MTDIPCIPSTSVEYITSAVTGNATPSDPAHMAVVPYGAEPTAGDWKTATWDNGAVKILIGAGSAVGALEEGLYGVWVRITTAAEQPVLYSGAIRIT